MVTKTPRPSLFHLCRAWAIFVQLIELGFDLLRSMNLKVMNHLATARRQEETAKLRDAFRSFPIIKCHQTVHQTASTCSKSLSAPPSWSTTTSTIPSTFSNRATAHILLPFQAGVHIHNQTSTPCKPIVYYGPTTTTTKYNPL